MAGAKRGKGRKRTKAQAAASATLGGRDTTPEQEIATPPPPAPKAVPWLNRPMLGTRITWRTVLLFLLACVMLDMVLWAVFEFGLGSCYGILCLL